MEKLKAVVYIRVSDQSQIDNNSLETQLKTCKQYAENNNYEVVEIFREEGVSAKHIQSRPAMRRMLDYCTLKKNRISAVIIYKMDRWSRNVEEGLMAESLLAKYGVSILPATEITEQNPIGKAVRTILMTMGQLDNELKGERVKDNMQTMFRKGYWCWKPRMGYKRPFKTKEENKGKSIIIDKRLGGIIKAIFIKAAEVPISKNALAEYANELGFKEAYGESADGRTISRIIKDTSYYGYMYAPKWKEYSWGKYTPIVNQELWQKANVNVFGRSKKYKQQDSATFPLKGILNCSNCDHPLTSSNPRGTTKRYFYYECHNSKCSKRQRIRLEKAHRDFINILEQIRPSKRVLKLFSHLVFSEWEKGIVERKQEVKLIEERIKKLESQLTIIAESNAKFILTDDEAQQRAEVIRKELMVLSVERADTRIEQYDAEAVKNFAENFLLNLDRLWLHVELPHKQALQSEIFTNNLLVENGKIRTNGLARTFNLIEVLDVESIESVTPREFESLLLE